MSQRVHRCDDCGITEDRDIFAAYLGLYVTPIKDDDGAVTHLLDLEAARQGWLHRHDTDGTPRSGSTIKQRGRRTPRPSRRSVARIKARRKASTIRQSRSARTSPPTSPTAT